MSCAGTMRKRRSRNSDMVSTRTKREARAIFRLAEKGRPGMLAPRKTRIEDLLLSPDARIRLETERFLWEQEFGKARQTLDQKISGKTVQVVEAPPVETREEWLARNARLHTEAEQAATDDDEPRPN